MFNFYGENSFTISTRWTFFRVKLVFKFELEISWSSGPLDLLTQRPWDSWTLGLCDLFPPPPPPLIASSFTILHPFIFSFNSVSPNSFHFLLHPLTSFYLFLSPFTSWFGMVCFGMGGVVSDDYGPFWVLTLEIEIGDWRLTLDLYIDVKKLWVGGGGGCIWIITSALVLFECCPWILRSEAL